MKRTDFLKIIGAGSGGFLIGGLGTNLTELSYELKETIIYDNYINGLKFREADFLKANPDEGEPVVMQREVSNPYDYFAIKVIVRDIFIGYLPAHENIAIANMMDAGIQMTAIISKLHIDKSDHYYQKALAVQITTKLLAPIYNIEKTKNWKQSDDAIDVYRQGPDLIPNNNLKNS